MLEETSPEPVQSTTPVTHENVFQKIGHGVETVAKDLGHVVLEAVEFPDKAAKVIATVVKEDAPLKAQLLVLINQCKTTLGDGVDAVTQKGLNFAEDEQTVADVIALSKYVTETFVPLIEAVYTQLNQDVA
jgi:hypothetical protein